MWHRSPQPQKCVGKDAPVTEYAIRRIAIEASTKPQVLDPPFKEPFNSAVEKAMLLLEESGKRSIDHGGYCMIIRLKIRCRGKRGCDISSVPFKKLAFIGAPNSVFMVKAQWH